MTKKISILSIILFCVLSVRVVAQEYKLAVDNQSRLVLEELNKVTVEGYDGSEVVFTATNQNHERSERAEGLKQISGLGLEDNTGIGLAVEQAGSDVTVAQLSRRGGGSYQIKVPKNLSVVYRHSTPWGNEFSVQDISGELEIATTHNSVNLENVSGPMTVKTVHGKILAILSDNVQGPVSVVSAHGLIDVALPATLAANVEMMSDHGEMYTDFDIEYEKSAAELRRVSSSAVKGTINGGGEATVELSSAHGSVYLRKR